MTEPLSHVVRLARFIQAFDASALPDRILETLEGLLLYGLTVAIADHEEGDALQTAMPLVHAAPGRSGLFDAAATRSAADAAAINGALMFARNQVDTHADICGHVGCVAIPAVLAMAQDRGAPADVVVAALVAAYEVPPRIGRGVIARAVSRGFRGTSIYGIFGATAGAARVMGLDEARTAHALAIAANHAAGLTQCFAEGTPEAALHVAHAARAGVVSAQLAEQGIRAATQILEGAAGFHHAYTEASATLDLTGWTLPDVSVKPVPGCVINQNPVRVLLELLAREPVDQADVLEVTVALNPADAEYPGIRRVGPFPTRQGACMSTAFMMEMALCNRRLTFRDFQQHHGEDPIHAASRRVRVVADPALREPFSCRVALRLRDGRTLAAQPPGSGGALGAGPMAALCRTIAGEWRTADVETRFERLRAAVDGLVRRRAPGAVDDLLAATRVSHWPG